MSQIRWISATFAVLALAASPSVAAPAAITLGGPPGAPSKLTLQEDVRAGRFELTFTDLRNGPVELYGASASVLERAKAACVLTAVESKVVVDLAALPSAACESLFDPLKKGGALKVAVSAPGSARFGLLEYQPPPVYAGPSTEIEAPIHTDGRFMLEQVKLPMKLDLAGEECLVNVDTWHQLRCASDTRKISGSEEAKAAMQAALGRDDTLALYLKVRDAQSSSGEWRRFDFVAKRSKLPADGAQKPPATELGQRCKQKATADQGQAGTFYAVCADVVRGRENLVTLECASEGAQRSCTEIGDLLRINRRLVVYVWHEEGTSIRSALGGVAGYGAMVYEPVFEKGVRATGAPTLASEPLVYRFDPRKAGSAELTVTAHSASAGDEAAKVLASVTRTYTIENSYRIALRLGLGMNWAPWARKVGVLTSSNGQRYSAVLDGEGAGLVSTGLVAGATYFFHDMPENSPDIGAGVGVRIGVVGVSNNDVRALDSVMLGLEFLIGRDFSIGLFGGAIRHDTPLPGQEPGRVLSSDATKVDTQFGVTPGAALVLNFTPGFMKNVVPGP